LDWLAAPIDWHDDRLDRATPVGSAKNYFELFDDERDALGISIVEFATAYRHNFDAAVLGKTVEEE
jgi:hypothetical protein